jgi:chaperone required for assembly of F1-ATPase
MERFWENSSVVEHPAGFTVRLDGRAIRWARSRELVVPFKALAAEVAGEWQRAGLSGNVILPDHLPLTRLAATALERVGPNRDDIIGQLCSYGLNDLLCYRAEDPRLAEHEDQAWRPWLNWAGSRFGAHLTCGTGVTPIEHSPEAAAAFKAILIGMSDYDLAGLGLMVPALGSLVLALAIQAGELTPERGCEIAQIDEIWQESRWGTDPVAVGRRKSVLDDVAVGARFMILCRS